MIHVLYHDDLDGFAAAWSANLALRRDPRKQVYTRVQYGQKMPVIEDNSVVFILDFSYPREELEALASRCEVTVLDHHKTAEEALRGLPYCTFDMNKSGCRLAWEHFHPHMPCPDAILAVENRDLWLLDREYVREICAALESYPRSFEEWDRMVIDIPKLLEEGKTLVRYISKLVYSHTRDPLVAVIGGYDVPVVNATTLQSEMANTLLEKYPKFPFATCYFDCPRGRIWSLRSREDFDVSAVAKLYGGGGHKQAAGFVVPFDMVTIKEMK